MDERTSIRESDTENTDERMHKYFKHSHDFAKPHLLKLYPIKDVLK